MINKSIIPISLGRYNALITIHVKKLL